MKRLLLILLSTFYLLLATSNVHADFTSAYNDYVSQYNSYRLSLNDFQQNKNKYLTYKTLTSQTDALSATKTFLLDRDFTLIAYLKLLQYPNPNTALLNLINDELTFYQNRHDLITAVGNLNDAADISQQAASHYPITEAIARKTIGTILLDKLQIFYTRQGKIESDFNQRIGFLKSEGKNVTNLERWAVSLANKRLLALEKLSETQTLINRIAPKTSDELLRDFNKIQLLLNDANQYLKEGNSYLLEIKEELKYGNY